MMKTIQNYSDNSIKWLKRSHWDNLQRTEKRILCLVWTITDFNLGETLSGKNQRYIFQETSLKQSKSCGKEGKTNPIHCKKFRLLSFILNTSPINCKAQQITMYEKLECHNFSPRYWYSGGSRISQSGGCQHLSLEQKTYCLLRFLPKKLYENEINWTEGTSLTSGSVKVIVNQVCGWI